jgi:hypothetical protein
MQKWEYLSISVALNKQGDITLIFSNYLPDLRFPKRLKWPDFVEYLNELGEEGWEMVNVYLQKVENSPAFYFKRPRE